MLIRRYYACYMKRESTSFLLAFNLLYRLDITRVQIRNIFIFSCVLDV